MVIKNITIRSDFHVSRDHRQGCRSALRIMKRWIKGRPDMTIAKMVELISELESKMDQEDENAAMDQVLS